MTAMYSVSSVILQSIQLLPLLSVLMDATVSFEMSVELCQVVLHPSQKRTFLVDWGCSRMGCRGDIWTSVGGSARRRKRVMMGRELHKLCSSPHVNMVIK